jgi:hypothetical protein
MADNGERVNNKPKKNFTKENIDRKKNIFPSGFHNTVDPKFGLAKSYIKFSFLQGTIPVDSQKRTYGSCPSSIGFTSGFSFGRKKTARFQNLHLRLNLIQNRIPN